MWHVRYSCVSFLVSSVGYGQSLATGGCFGVTYHSPEQRQNVATDTREKKLRNKTNNSSSSSNDYNTRISSCLRQLVRRSHQLFSRDTHLASSKPMCPRAVQERSGLMKARRGNGEMMYTTYKGPWRRTTGTETHVANTSADGDEASALLKRPLVSTASARRPSSSASSAVPRSSQSHSFASKRRSIWLSSEDYARSVLASTGHISRRTTGACNALAIALPLERISELGFSTLGRVQAPSDGSTEVSRRDLSNTPRVCWVRRHSFGKKRIQKCPRECCFSTRVLRIYTKTILEPPGRCAARIHQPS